MAKHCVDGLALSVRGTTVLVAALLLTGCESLLIDLENSQRKRDGRPLLQTAEQLRDRLTYENITANVLAGRTFPSGGAKLTDVGENLKSGDGATLSLGVSGPVARLPAGPPVIASAEATVVDTGKGKPGAAGSESSSTDIFGRATVGVPFGLGPGESSPRAAFIMPYLGGQVLGASTERSAAGFNSSNDFLGVGPVVGAEFTMWLFDPFGTPGSAPRPGARADARDGSISFSLDVSTAALFGTLKERSNAGFRSNDSRTVFQSTARASITYWLTSTFGLSIGGGVNHLTKVEDSTAGAGSDGSNDRTTFFVTAGGKIVLR